MRDGEIAKREEVVCFWVSVVGMGWTVGRIWRGKLLVVGVGYDITDASVLKWGPYLPYPDGEVVMPHDLTGAPITGIVSE